MKINTSNEYMQMKYKKSQYGFCVFFIALTFLALVLIWKNNSKSVEYNNIGIGGYQLILLDNDSVVTQSFTMKGQELEYVDFMMSGFSDNSKAKVSLEITDGQDSIFQKYVPIKMINNGSFTRVTIGQILGDNKNYCLNLTCKGLNKNENIPCLVCVIPNNASELCTTLVRNDEIVEYRKLALNFGCLSPYSVSEYNIHSLITVIVFIVMGILIFQQLKIKNILVMPDRAFLFFSIVSIVALIFSIYFSHGSLIEHYLFSDTKDTAMDFMHSIEYLKGNSPYEIFETLYPPLANVFFGLLLNFVPEELADRWSMSVSDSVALRGTELDLRTNQSTLILFLIFIMVFTYGFIVLISQILKQNKYKSFLIFCLLLTKPILYSIERGNIVLISFLFLFIFVFYRNSNNPIIRELSYISLAISAGLKLYPAVMGLLLVKERKWKEAIRTVFYGVAAIIFPCFFLNEGIEGLKIWFKVVINFNNDSLTPWVGFGVKNMLYRFDIYAERLTRIIVSDQTINVIYLVIILLLVLFALRAKSEWKAILLLTFILVTITSQAEYSQVFFIIPFIAFINTEKLLDANNFVPYISMVIFILPFPLFNVGDFSCPRMVLIQLTYVMLIVWAIIDDAAVINFMSRVKKRVQKGVES